MNAKFGWAIVFLLFVGFIQQADAIEADMRPKIESACNTTFKINNPKAENSKVLCACIAKKHFEAATKEPKESDGRKQLNWVLLFYQTHDRAELKKLLKRPENLSDFDEMVVDDCTEESANLKLSK